MHIFYDGNFSTAATNWQLANQHVKATSLPQLSGYSHLEELGALLSNASHEIARIAGCMRAAMQKSLICSFYNHVHTCAHHATQ